MDVSRLTIENFGPFERASFDLSPGINVLIGENSTGKSYVLKLLYAVLKAVDQATPQEREDLDRFHFQLSKKLAAVFRPDDGDTGRLIRRGARRKAARVEVEWSQGAELSLSLLGARQTRVSLKSWPQVSRSLFLPSREVLAMYEGFINAYDNRELSFDETYFDACVALSGSLLRGGRAQAAAKLLQPVEAALGGKVTREGDRFYVDLGGKMEAHLVAEGLRKLASLAFLIANGSLASKTILFWDEPEANLNPRLISRVAEFLRLLAADGVQILVATHDYLLTHKLSLAAEYHQGPQVPLRFFSLLRDATGAVQVEAADTLPEIQHNPILEEFAAHHDEERALFVAEAAEHEERP